MLYLPPRSSSPPISQNNYTPLLVACEYQKVEMVRYLTEERTDVDISACCHTNGNGDGTSGLHLAAIHNSSGVAELLIKANCPLDLVDKSVSSGVICLALR